jgi:hypothetical protein
MRYERSREALEHGRILTQRHEATDAELAMAEGDRPLVRKNVPKRKKIRKSTNKSE